MSSAQAAGVMMGNLRQIYRSFGGMRVGATRLQSTVSTAKRPMKACVIGSGPAGFYTAYRLLSNLADCTVDIYEALPAPYGLARYGVAPDHPEVKNVTHKFDEVATSPRVRFFGNVRVGQDVAMKTLRRAYDSIIFAHGASMNKTLGIKGETLPGVISARSFVGWYNGLPEASDLNPGVEHAETAIVVGQGNVALDIARILLSSVDDLRKTDISEQALEKLTRSKIRRVNIIGRRGPLQASFTIKEIRELINTPGTNFANSSQEFYKQILESTNLQRPQKRLMELLAKQNFAGSGESRSWDIQYCLSPTEFRGTTQLKSVLFEKNSLKEVAGQFKAIGTGESLTQDAQLAFLSIGYQSEAITGMEDIGVIFDTTRHIVPNEGGRVSTMDGFVPGIYCSGWAKVGPVGVIASTMRDAFETADLVAQDWLDPSFAPEQLELDTHELVRDISERIQVVTWQDWQKVQLHEVTTANEQDPARPAKKVINIDEMLRIARET